jgi:hypothetical protein
MVSMTPLEFEQCELLPARQALQGGLIDINVETVVQAPVNLAIAVLGAVAFAGQVVAGSA